MPASPELAQAHRRWREPPQDPQQLGDFRKALAATMESIERQLHCAAALNLDQEQVSRMQEEYSVLLYQMMHSRSPQARIMKQRMFVGRCKKRLMDAQAKMHLLQEQLEAADTQCQVLTHELAQAEQLLEHVEDLDDEQPIAGNIAVPDDGDDELMTDGPFAQT
eukprot:7138558-Pyramimonas_sp.AAC.1